MELKVPGSMVGRPQYIFFFWLPSKIELEIYSIIYDWFLINKKNSSELMISQFNEFDVCWDGTLRGFQLLKVVKMLQTRSFFC